MENSKQYGIFEQVEFLNEGYAAAALLIGGGALVGSLIKKRIDKDKTKKSGNEISEDELEEILDVLKPLSYELDKCRSKISQYKYLTDLDPQFKLSNTYFNIFKNGFNRGDVVSPFYMISAGINDNAIFDDMRNDTDLLDFMKKIAIQYCKNNKFDIINENDKKNSFLIGRKDNFDVRLDYESVGDSYQIWLIYNKKVIKEK